MPSHDHLGVISMIKKENDLKDDTIVENQKLIIPYEVSLESKSASTSVDKTKETDKDTAQNTKTGKKYVVQSGDSLWKIASEQMPKTAQLEAVGKIKAHNNITDENTIKAGDTLYIPEQ
jgi:LysM repeat protein